MTKCNIATYDIGIFICKIRYTIVHLGYVLLMPCFIIIKVSYLDNTLTFHL